MTGGKRAPVPNLSWAYFLDLDGTLVELARSPGRVRIDRTLRRFIEELHQASGGAVALITGRTLADVDQLFPGFRLAAAGQHGAERRSASGRMFRHPFPSRQLDGVRSRLAEAVARHPGLLLEDKGLSLALHYRGAPALAGYAHRLVGAMMPRLGKGFALQPGKRIVEIRMTGKDKGTAIQEFMSERPFRGRMPAFLGDDLTDEYGFAMINRLGGYSIKVGIGPTAARWRLRDVTEVRGWLKRGRPAPRPTR